MRYRPVNVFGSSAGAGNKYSVSRRRAGQKTFLVPTKTEKVRQGFRLFVQDHPDGKHHHVEGFLHDLAPLCVRQSDSEILCYRGMIDPGGKGSDKTNPFILPTGIQKIMKGCAGRLDVHIQECGVDLGIFMPDCPDETEGIGAADLRAVPIPYRLVTASHALDKYDILRHFTVGRTVDLPLKTKHLFQVACRNDILDDAVSVFTLFGSIEGVNSRGDDNGRRF